MRLINNTARFTHGMAIMFAIGCALALVVVSMRGPPEGCSQSMTWLVLGLFATAAVGIIFYASRTSAIIIQLRDDRTLIVTEQALFRKVTRCIRHDDVLSVSTEQSKDQDGSDYFRAVLCLKDGSRLVAREGHDKNQVGEAVELIKATLRE